MSDMFPLAEELTRVYARMSGFLLSEETVQTALDLVTSLALDTIVGAVGAGVTLLDSEGRKESAGATSDLVAAADDLQYELDDGPCLTACRQNTIVRIDDLERDDRWPRWREQALPLGVRSTLSAPLGTPRRVLGALKIYGSQPGAFDDRSVQLLTRFAEQATILLSNVTTLNKAERLSENLQQALRTRNAIALASGVLMERHHLNEEQAFLRLVESSRQQHRELADEAAAVIASTSAEHG
jgi:GAF domain-containing protein